MLGRDVLEEEEIEISLGEIWGVVRKNLKLIIILTALFGILGLVVNLFVLHPTYTAYSRVYVMNTTSATTMDSNGDMSVDAGDLNSSLMLSKDYIEIINSDLVTDAAAKKLGVKNLKAYEVNVTAAEDTRMIKIMVTGEDPEKTAKLANILTGELTSCVRDVIKIDNVTVIDWAKNPTIPSGPAKAKNTVLAAMVGFILALGIAFLRFFMDTTIKSNEDVEKYLNLPVLARIPHFGE